MAKDFEQALDRANAAIEQAFHLAEDAESCQRLYRKLELYSECLARRGAALLEFLEMIDEEKRRKLTEFFTEAAHSTEEIRRGSESGQISQAEGKRRVLRQIDLMRKEVEQVETLELNPRNRVSQYFKED